MNSEVRSVIGTVLEWGDHSIDKTTMILRVALAYVHKKRVNNSSAYFSVSEESFNIDSLNIKIFTYAVRV